MFLNVERKKQILLVSIGGHLPLPVLHTAEETCFLQGKGFPVGLFEEASYSDHTLELPASFSLALFSDGIFDLLPGENLKAKEASLPEQVRLANGTLGGISKQLGLANLGEMPDDIAMLVLSRNLA